MTQTMRETTGISAPFSPAGIPFHRKIRDDGEYPEPRAETREHAQHGPAVLGVFFMSAIFFRVEAAGFSENGTEFQLCRYHAGERPTPDSAAPLPQGQLLTDAHAPFRQARAVDSGVEILQIEKLVEGADELNCEARKSVPQAALMRRDSSAPETGNPP